MLSQTYLYNNLSAIFLRKKGCLLTMRQHCTGNVLAQSQSTQIKTILQIIFLCIVVHGLQINIAHVNNFLVQTLRQLDQDNFIQVIFLQKHICELRANIEQVFFFFFFFCAMFSQTYLDNIDQTIFLCNVVPLWLI